MKRFQSILCASLLTLAMSSATFGGTIYGRTGTIYGAPSSSSTDKTGTIYGKTGTIYGISGTIYGITDEAYSEFVGLLTVLIP
jgi:hypothetical protein